MKLQKMPAGARAFSLPRILEKTLETRLEDCKICSEAIKSSNYQIILRAQFIMIIALSGVQFGLKSSA